jgi:4-hydroxy-tetrahydrodipicolinate synthase
VCAIKEGVMEEYGRTAELHALAPDLAIWECDLVVYRAGWLQQGIVCAAQLGTCGYLHETPDKRWLTEYWSLIWDGKLAEAIEYSAVSGLDALVGGIYRWFTTYPGRADYFTHWGEAFRFAASCVGLPVGDYPHSRAAQGILPESAKQQIRAAYESAGFTAARSDSVAKRSVSVRA